MMTEPTLYGLTPRGRTQHILSMDRAPYCDKRVTTWGPRLASMRVCRMCQRNFERAVQRKSLASFLAARSDSSAREWSDRL